jgi:hypothetical protein
MKDSYRRNKEKTDDIIDSLKKKDFPVNIVFSYDVDSTSKSFEDGREIYLTSLAIDFFLTYPQIGHSEKYLTILAENIHAISPEGVKAIMQGRGKKEYDLSDSVLEEDSRLRFNAGIAYILCRLDDEAIPFELTDEQGNSLKLDYREILEKAIKKDINPSEHCTHNSLLETIDA